MLANPPPRIAIPGPVRLMQLFMRLEQAQSCGSVRAANQGGASGKGHVTFPISFKTSRKMTMTHEGQTAMVPRFWNTTNTGFDFTVYWLNGNEATSGADSQWIAIGV